MSEEQYISWKAEPEFRGTFNILITCLTTLGICVWSALHLSIPQTVQSWHKSLGVRLLWVTIGLFMPEMLIMSALGQRQVAGQLRDIANKEFGSQRTKDLEKSEEEQPLRAAKSSQRQYRWTRVHGFYAKMGGFAFELSDKTHQRIVLTSSNVEYLLRHKTELIPDISEATICDKSKADGLAKALLFAQASWFCINSLARLVQHLPLALLEVSTLAHAMCSLYVYILWWHKPLNVQEPTIIPEPDEETKEKIGQGRQGDAFDNEYPENVRTALFGIVAIGISLIYGAPHLLAWNTAFPTEIERLLWRIAALVVTCSAVWVVAVAAVHPVFPDWIVVIIGVASLFAYAVASLYLTVESFRQLFHLPSGAFILPLWSNYFPHFS